MRKLLSGLWLLALLGAASAQTLGPGASGPCSAFGTTAGTCAQGNAAVPYTGAASAVNLNGQQLNNVIIGTTTPLAGLFTTLNASGIFASTNATSGTSTTAAALTANSLGLMENLWVGGQIHSGAAFFPGAGSFSAGVAQVYTSIGAGGTGLTFTAGTNASGAAEIAFYNSAGVNIFAVLPGTSNLQLSSPLNGPVVAIQPTTPSTSTTTGALTVAGGLGVVANAYVGGSMTAVGQLVVATGLPTIASGACGTGTNGTIAGDNQSGIITIGAVATTSCAVTFSKTLANAPKSCVAFPGNATAAGATILAHIDTIAATGFTLSGAVLASTKFNFHCY